MPRYLFVATLLAMLPSTSSHARAPLTDHPLIAPYEGSTLRRKDVKAFDVYNAFIGMDNTGKKPLELSLEGKITRLFYMKPKSRSIFEVFKNYESAVKRAGAEILYTCDQEKKGCVERYAGPTLQKLSGLHAISNLKGRYLLAKLTEGDNTAYIAIGVGQTFTDVHVIEIQEMQRDQVSLDAAALGKGLDARGYVILDGLFFDTNKATLQDRSKAVLSEIAKLLKSRPKLNVFVVGHTDMSGNFGYNKGLSQRRAQAVVEALASDHGLKRERMEAHGVGPLAPQATNGTEKGRARNRRVVLVARN